MCPLCPRKRASRWGLSQWRGVSYSDVNALMSKELHQLPPMEATLPVSKDAQHEEPVWVRIPLMRVRTHLRTMNWKRQANKPY